MQTLLLLCSFDNTSCCAGNSALDTCFIFFIQIIAANESIFSLLAVGHPILFNDGIRDRSWLYKSVCATVGLFPDSRFLSPRTTTNCYNNLVRNSMGVSDGTADDLTPKFNLVPWHSVFYTQHVLLSSVLATIFLFKNILLFISMKEKQETIYHFTSNISYNLSTLISLNVLYCPHFDTKPFVIHRDNSMSYSRHTK